MSISKIVLCLAVCFIVSVTARTGIVLLINKNAICNYLHVSYCTFPGPSHDKVVVCYLSTWAVYRPNRGSYSIDNFDPNLCTHVIYAFSGLDAKTDSIKSLGKLIFKVSYNRNTLNRVGF